MFDLNTPTKPFTPLSGGNGGLPPIHDPRPFKPASDGGKPSRPAPQNNQASVIPAHTPPAYPKPRAWVEKRIALAIRHHAQFKAWRAREAAKLAAWVEAQPGYCPATAACEARMSEIRRAFRNRH